MITWAAAFAAMLALGAFLVRDRQPEAAVRRSRAVSSGPPLEAPPDFEGFIPLPTSGRAAGE